MLICSLVFTCHTRHKNVTHVTLIYPVKIAHSYCWYICLLIDFSDCTTLWVVAAYLDIHCRIFMMIWWNCLRLLKNTSKLPRKMFLVKLHVYFCYITIYFNIYVHMLTSFHNLTHPNRGVMIKISYSSHTSRISVTHVTQHFHQYCKMFQSLR